LTSCTTSAGGGEHAFRWSVQLQARRGRYRDANAMDLSKPEMRALIDLRSKPQFIDPLTRAPEQVLEPVSDRADHISTAGESEGRISTH
jgi:hypothetical protein